MHCVKKILDNLFWVGSDEHRNPLFENIHPIKNGISYNSYLLLDEKTVLFDTVDWSVCRQFLSNIEYVLNGKNLDYLVIHHMEPDHCASIEEVILRYPNVKIISSQKSFDFMKQFGFSVQGHEQIVKDGEEVNFGAHTIKFIGAAMVHWPEAMVSFDTTNKTLFSADAFGAFGALNGKILDSEISSNFIDEYRRYYSNIVGKFGAPVQSLLKKVENLDIAYICPLHGCVIQENVQLLMEKYRIWSSYTPEEQGVLVVYASMYGSTESCAKVLVSKLAEQNISNVDIFDVSNTDISTLISLSFKYSHIVFASPTYNAEMYPLIHNLINDMKSLNLQNRTIGIIENGTWVCLAGKHIEKLVSEMKNMTILKERVSILSSMNEKNIEQIDALVCKIVETL